MTTQPSVWDDPEVMVGGDYVTFENVGDTVSGTIDAIRIHRFEDGKAAPQILLTTDAGDEKTVTAGQVRLKAILSELRPKAGDHIVITLTGVEKRAGGKTLKLWNVDVIPGGGNGSGQPAYTPPATPAPVAAAAAPLAQPAMTPEQAQAALAALSPEMRAALGQLG
jgi:hypothetical protein